MKQIIHSIHSSVKLKSFKIFFLIFFAAILESNAQVLKYVGIGPFFTFKPGINVGNVQEGRKNAIAFSGIPDFGVTSKVILSENADLGLTFDLAYSSYAYQIKNADDNSIKYTLKYGYITLNPNLYFSKLILGLN